MQESRKFKGIRAAQRFLETIEWRYPLRLWPDRGDQESASQIARNGAQFKDVWREMKKSPASKDSSI